MEVDRVGYGAGGRGQRGLIEILVLIGRAAERAETDRVSVIECEIDDMNPQIFSVVMDQLCTPAPSTCSTCRST